MKQRKTIMIVFAALLISMLSLTANAATWKTYLWADDAPVKAGGKWFRTVLAESSNGWETQIQMSKKSKKSGYTTIVKGLNMSNCFVTDGKKLYYLDKNVLKMYTVSSKKKASVKKLPLPSKHSYYMLSGFHNGKIWFLCREDNNRGRQMVSWDVKKKKLKVEKKNFLIWNAPVISRYSVVTTGTKKLSGEAGATYVLKVWDKDTGKFTKISAAARPMITAAGGIYSTMAKWFIFGEYSEEKGCWQVKQYTFRTKKTRVLRSLKAGETFDGLMYVGDGVMLMTGDGTFTDENHIRAV